VTLTVTDTLGKSDVASTTFTIAAVPAAGPPAAAAIAPAPGGGSADPASTTATAGGGSLDAGALLGLLVALLGLIAGTRRQPRPR
jgi:hypothetical protein